MARSRNIKPGFYKNEFLAQCSPYARLLFAGLWLLADRRGRLEDRPLKIKGELFPFEAVEVNELLQELAESTGNFISRYTVNGQALIQIENFHKHQKPHKNEVESTLPPFIKQHSRNGASDSIQIPSASDFIGTTREKDLSTPADSLTLIPDSLTHESDAQASVCVNENGLNKNENEKLAEEGMSYLSSLNHPNHSGIGWIAGYLGIQFQELETNRPELSKQQILSVWRDVCDLAVAKNASAPQWFKTTFKNKLEGTTPNAIKSPLPEAGNEQAEALLKFPSIRHIVTGEIFSSNSLEYRPEAKGGLHHKEYPSFYPLSHLEGLEGGLSDEA
jgi:hypothetical protein